MPKPKSGESEKDFVARCIPIVLEDGTAEDQEQAAAVCYSMYREVREMEYGTAAEKIKALYALAKELMAMLEPVDDDQADDDQMEVAEVAQPLAIEEYQGDLSEVGESLPVDKGRRAPVYVDFAIIKPGPGNKRDRRYYRADVLKRDAHVFEGNDVFVTDHKEQERSERTKAGKVIKCPVRFTEAGEPVGRVLIYDPDQAEKVRNRNDAGELGTLECSIFAKGTAKDGVIDGEKYSIVESITEGVYVELVSKAGAGGRALSLAESEGGSFVDEKEKVVEESQPKEQPKLVEIREAEPVTLLESDQVRELLKTARLPPAAKAKLAEREYKNEAELKEAIDRESEYLAEIMESGKPFAQGAQPQIEQPLVEVDKSIATVNKRWGF